MPSNAVVVLLYPGATSLRFGSGRQPAVELASPLARHHPHNAGRSDSGLGVAPRSEFALQRQHSPRACARKPGRDCGAGRLRRLHSMVRPSAKRRRSLLESCHPRMQRWKSCATGKWMTVRSVPTPHRPGDIGIYRSSKAAIEGRLPRGTKAGRADSTQNEGWSRPDRAAQRRRWKAFRSRNARLSGSE
jgi:hypothetical protein